MKLKKLNKKTILIAAAALLVLAGLILGVCALVNRKPKLYAVDAPDAKDSAVTLVADHGLSALAPANTASAFLRAGQNGYDGVYFEARRTADGVWVVLEEENIRCATDGSGKIGRLTYKQLLRYRVNKGNGLKAFKDNPLTVTTLTQALAACSQYGMTPVIEVTADSADELEKLFKAVAGRYKKECCFVFRDGELLTTAKELLATAGFPLKAKNVSLWLSVQKLNSKALEEARKHPDAVVCFPAGKASAKRLARFTDAGLTLCARGVNKPKQLQTLAAAGVAVFTTDRLAHSEILTEDAEKTTAPRVTAPQNRPSTTAAKPTEKATVKPTEKPTEMPSAQ